MTPRELQQAFHPLLAGELALWRGLPDATPEELAAALGEASAPETVTVGAYPAERLELRLRDEEPVVAAFVRHGRVILVEVVPPPGMDAMAGLPEPTAVLPQEIEVEDAYAHEYLWAERGLLLTLAQAFDRPEPDRLVRCRGIRPIADRSGLGAELYMPLDTQVKW